MGQGKKNHLNVTAKIFVALYQAATWLAAELAVPYLRLTYGASDLPGSYQERYGKWKGTLPDEFIWFHGASVGEVNSLIPVIKAWRAKHPNIHTLLTATTTTGLERGKESVHEVHLLPFDHRVFISKALGNTKPVRFVFGETELWPELLSYLNKKKVPCYLVNGRISARSFRRYQKVQKIISPTLQLLRRICVSTQESRDRFIALGADEKKVIITGNAKYDVVPRIDGRSPLEPFFQNVGVILTLGSLRPGEEKKWFPVIARLINSSQYSDLRVLIVPRHREKFQEFANALNQHRIAFDAYSKLLGLPSKKSVILVDAMGNLERAYSCSRMSFIGGTLFSEHGGHNPLESAMYKNALLLGPYGETIQEVRQSLLNNNAVMIVRNEFEIEAALTRLLNDKNLAHTMGEGAFSVWEKYRGATARILEAIED